MPNWLIGLILFAPFLIGYVVVDRVEWHREQTFLKVVFDGDKQQQRRAERYQRRRVNKLAARHGRYFN